MAGYRAKWLVWVNRLPNAAWVNIDHGLRAGGEFLLTLLLARFLVPAQFGNYQLLLSILMVGSLFSLSGFNGSLMRALAQGYEGTLQAVTDLAWRWSLLGVVILWVLGGYWAQTGSTMLGYSLLLVSVLFPYFHVYRRWQVVLHAQERFALRAWYDLLVTGSVLLVVGLVLAVLPSSLPLLFVVYVGITAISHFLVYRIVARQVTRGATEPGWRTSGYRLVGSEVFGVLYAYLDKLALAFWLGPTSLAIYAVAIVFGEGLKLVAGNVIMAYVPQLYRDGTGVLRGSVGHRMVILLIVAILGIALTWWLMPILLPLIFSDSYASSVEVARWYLLVVPGHVVASIGGYLLIRARLERAMLASFVVAGLVNVLSYVLLIPRIGITGAVLGSVLYYLVLAAMSWGLLHYGRRGYATRSQS